MFKTRVCERMMIEGCNGMKLVSTTADRGSSVRANIFADDFSFVQQNSKHWTTARCPIPVVPVTVFDSSGVVVDTTLTDSNG